MSCDRTESSVSTFFFFNDTAPTEIYPLSLHDALPIAHGLGGAVPVSRPTLHPHRAGDPRRNHRVHAAARGMGRAEPACEPLGFPRLLSGNGDRARRCLARLARAG